MTTPRKREYVLMALAASLALFAWAGGDKPKDSVLEPLPLPVQTDATPYIPCPKLRNGAWLRSEIAQQRGDGWVIACSYWGHELMTRDEVSL